MAQKKVDGSHLIHIDTVLFRRLSATKLGSPYQEWGWGWGLQYTRQRGDRVAKTNHTRAISTVDTERLFTNYPFCNDIILLESTRRSYWSGSFVLSSLLLLRLSLSSDNNKSKKSKRNNEKKTGEDWSQSFFPSVHQIWWHLCISRGAMVKVCQVWEVVKPPLLCVSFLLLWAARKRLGLGKFDHSDDPNDHFPPIHPLGPPARYFHSWVLRVCPDDACEAAGQPAKGAPDWLKGVAAGPPPLIVMPDICWVIWVWKGKKEEGGGGGCLSVWIASKNGITHLMSTESTPLLCLALLFTLTSATWAFPCSLPSSPPIRPFFHVHLPALHPTLIPSDLLPLPPSFPALSIFNVQCYSLIWPSESYGWVCVKVYLGAVVHVGWLSLDIRGTTHSSTCHYCTPHTHTQERCVCVPVVIYDRSLGSPVVKMLTAVLSAE